MRNLSGALGENSWAQLTMNSSASSSRFFSMNGEGSIELKSWFMSRSFRLMCGDAPGPLRQCAGMKNAYEDLYYLRSTIGRQSLPQLTAQKLNTNTDARLEMSIPATLCHIRRTRRWRKGPSSNQCGCGRRAE